MPGLFAKGLLRTALCTGLLLLSAVAQAAAPFVVRDMRVDGLQRIAEGTVFNYLPISIGDTVDDTRIEEAIRAVYGTGLFQDVQFNRDGNTLVITVQERPSIKSFTIDGNEDIKTEDLEDALRQQGLAPGRTFNRSVLESATQFLTDQYFGRGKYNVQVNTSVQELPDNTVEIAIDIKEGKRARIQQINVVGNEIFDDDQLLEEFTMKTRNWLCFYKQDCNYAREVLLGDIETLTSYYLDRGYADFEVTSTQVAISPDKQNIFVTLNVAEGEPYVIGDVKLAGDLVLPEAQLERLIMVSPGETFSRRRLTQTSELISYRLGEEGYAFARVEPVPNLDDEAKTVSLTFYVDPGKRAYVRRVNFYGTTSTDDEVFRREMRQLEGGFLSNRAVERSEQRVRRLPFIEEVSVDTTPVAGTDDLVDIDFNVTEGMPGSFGGGIGYSGSQGILLNGNFVHTNFLGTGNRIEADVNTGRYSTVYRFSFTDPYVTPDGVSRSISLAYRDITQFTSGSSDFSTETWTLGADWGYPISEYSRIRFGFAFQDAELSANSNSPVQTQQWVRNNGNSSTKTVTLDNGQEFTFLTTDFLSYELTAGWVYDSRNRVIFGNRGARQRLTFGITGPGSEVEYWTLRYDFLKYWPIYGPFVLEWTADFGWADDIGDTTDPPPYKNFFGGGPNSVRGFKEGRLGPQDSFGRAWGGNVKMASQMELILPNLKQWEGQSRFSLFFDAGNVFCECATPFFDSDGNLVDYGVDLNELRYSVGLAAQWLAPLGLFKLSYGIPLNDDDQDQTEEIQFSVGSAF